MTKWFCDASYNNQCRIGVIGYKSENSPVYTYESSSGKNTELEFIAFNEVLDHVSEGDIIYTDCQRIVDLVENRNPSYGYQSSLLQRIDQVKIRALKIDGHKPSKDKDADDIQFSQVDKAVRRHLRLICQ
jgi:hypothetical protein